MDRLWSIQVLRFVAALLVVYVHAALDAFSLTHQTWLTGHTGLVIGRCGVDIFFVISGFIITRTSKGLSAGAFVAHRARRILPLWVAVSAAWMFCTVLTSGVGWRALLATWLFWPATDVMTAPIIPVGWTLCFEVLFYAAFATAIWRPKALWFIGAVFIFASVTRVGPMLQFLGNPLILEFLAGVVLAHAPRWRPAVFAIPIGAALLVFGARFAGPLNESSADFLRGADAWTRVASTGLPSVLIVWGVLQLKARPSVFTYLGDASYALYLVHPPVVLVTAAIAARIGHAPTAIVILAAVAAGVLACWPAHEWIEKPLMALARRGLQRAAPATV